MLKIIFFLLLLPCFLWAENTSCKKPVVWLSYNVQNLFDDKIDNTEYKNQHVTKHESKLKISKLSEVFNKIEKEYGNLGVVLLQEVENEQIVQSLRKSTKSLKPLNVAFIKDEKQAIGLAILTRYPIKKIKQLDPRLFNKDISFSMGSRPILLVTITIGTQDILIINVHLPSKIKAKNELIRHNTLSFLGNYIKEVLTQGQSVFLGGDFNEDITQITHDIFPQSDSQKDPLKQGLLLVNGYHLLPNNLQQIRDIGTYFYKGWAKLDHLLFSSDFFDKKNVDYEKIIIYSDDYLLEKKGKNIIPKAFQKNKDKLEAGYSDHLPIFALIQEDFENKICIN